MRPVARSVTGLGDPQTRSVRTAVTVRAGRPALASDVFRPK
jgi:hypothetical protein